MVRVAILSSIYIVGVCFSALGQNPFLLYDSCKSLIISDSMAQVAEELTFSTDYSIMDGTYELMGSVRIEKNCLIIPIGSSKADTFELIWNGRIQNATPERVELILINKGSHEDDLRFHTPRFDLSPIKTMTSAKKIMVLLRAYPYSEFEKRIEWNQ